MLKNRIPKTFANKKIDSINIELIGFFKPTYGSKTLYISIYGGNIRIMISKINLSNQFMHR